MNINDFKVKCKENELTEVIIPFFEAMKQLSPKDIKTLLNVNIHIIGSLLVIEQNENIVGYIAEERSVLNEL